MGKKLDENRNKNINKIKIGACLELTFLFDNIENNIDRVKGFLETNSNLFTNQSQYTILKMFDDIQCVLDNHINIVLADIDKEENFCKYHSKYY